MPKEYVVNVNGSYRVEGTRVSLASVVHLFEEGTSAEGIVESYPALTLEQVYGALAFYLANEKAVQGHMAESERRAEAEYARSRVSNADLIAKLRRARDEHRVSG